MKESYETPNPDQVAAKHLERHPGHTIHTMQQEGEKRPMVTKCVECDLFWYNPAYVSLAFKDQDPGEGWFKVRGRIG